MIHTCKKCGKQFEDERKQAAVCYECRTTACVICGERFVPTNKGQVTCSQKCSGIRKSQLGIAAKAASTKPTQTKICKFCGKEFLPRTFRQIYCDGPHYKPCPVCGKPVQINTPSDPAVTCSSECQKMMTQSTCLSKYGNVNVLNSDHGREKAKQSCLERYGVEDYRSSAQFKQQYQTTMQARYGVNYPLQSAEIKEKTKQTNIKRYGSAGPMYSDEVKQKALQSAVEHYGGFGMASPVLRERIKATNTEKYGVPYVAWSDEFSFSTYSISKTNLHFQDKLQAAGIDCIMEFPLSYESIEDNEIHRYCYDFKINDTTLVDIDPSYTHNDVGNHWGYVVSSDYHSKRSAVARNNGYRCMHIFDWDDWDSIIRMLLPATSIYARKCKLQKVAQEVADQFTSEHHLQGKCRGQIDNYGLFYDDELVQVMTFGRPRYNKHYDVELLRLCSKTGIRVVGGASKLFRAFVKDNPDKSIISYCNLAKFTGAVYEQIGMTLDNVSAPAKVWSKGKKFITDNLLRQRGYDQIFGTHFGKGTSNEELMLNDGWLPVYDCGQAVYTYVPLQNEQQRAGYEAAERLMKKYPKAMKVLAQ